LRHAFAGRLVHPGIHAAMLSRISETAMPRSSNAPDLGDAPAPYRRTMFDRHGPDAAMRLRVVPYVVVTFVCMVALFAALRQKHGYSGFLVLPFAAVATTAVAWAGLRVATAAGEAIGHFVVPSGESTPYEHQFSREESLVARGDIAGALESLEMAIRATPIAAQTGVAVRIRAAELHMAEGGTIARAVALFREVQRFPGVTAGQDIYVSNRLIDLLLGPFDQPARALVELRRIIDRYPSSSAAMHARTAITTVKRHLRGEANHG
jgi:hypothetical protein